MKAITRITIIFVSLALFMLTNVSGKPDSESPIRHVVVFKFSDAATEAQLETVLDAFRKLSKSIPGILSFEHGINNSPENLNRGLSHVYVLTFENAAARDAYLPHPEHKAFGKMLGELGVFEEVFVVDYVPSE